tara:strand:+ start:507 stop:947 length:441 start_codon:yes stop_codon:yes gene_type:complete
MEGNMGNLKKMGFVALALLSGCMGNSVSKVETTQEPTELVKPSGYEPKLRAYALSLLKDPDSMKAFEVTEPAIGTYYAGIYGGFKYEQLYYICYKFNAKNSYGGYVGVKQYIAFFKGNEIYFKGNNPTVTSGYSNDYFKYSCKNYS